MIIHTRAVIITDAASGIGKATAKKFANDGLNVVVNGKIKSKLQAV